MKRNVLHGFILWTCIVCAVAQAPAPAPSHNRDENVEHVSFVTEDGALIYADLLPDIVIGHVVKHQGAVLSRSARSSNPTRTTREPDSKEAR